LHYEILSIISGIELYIYFYSLYNNQIALQRLKDRIQKLLGNVLESQAGCGPLIDFCVMTYEVEDEYNNFIRIYKMFNTVLED